MSGNPVTKKGDKRPPFNFNKVTQFAKKMETVNILQLLWDTWSQKGVETVMKSVDNYMKIGNKQKNT